jgi:hypothetical protein
VICDDEGGGREERRGWREQNLPVTFLRRGLIRKPCYVRYIFLTIIVRALWRSTS